MVSPNIVTYIKFLNSNPVEGGSRDLLVFLFVVTLPALDPQEK